MRKKYLNELIEFSQTVRVLYVEPNEKKREQILSIFFKNIDIAVDGRDALEHFYNKKYDLIITHIHLPDRNGIDMLKEIRTVSKHITVLVISAEVNYFIELIKLGIDGYILEPLKIEQFISVIKKVIEKLKNKEELYQYRTNLEKKVNEEIFKRTTNEKILLQQSKLALMGEMIDSVAHQWRQPINNINLNVDMLQYDFEDGLITEEYIKEFSEKISGQITHMNNTLSEFRNFFRPDKKIIPFSIETACQSVIVLMQDEIKKHTIQIKLNIIDNFIIDAIENEFKHVLINLISNSKDAFEENRIKDKNIVITAQIKEGKKLIIFEDNAGGIPKNIIEKVFEANITSKSSDKGTGIGLYMSRLIVEKYDGTISVLSSTKKKGTAFTVSFN